MSFIDCCRLCLNDQALSEMRLINETTMNDQPLQREIQECFQISIEDHETMNKICGSCYNDVQFLVTFRKKVQEADFAIKNYYLEMNTKYEVEYLVEDQYLPVTNINHVSTENSSFASESNNKPTNSNDDDKDSTCLNKSAVIKDSDHLKKYEFVEIEANLVGEIVHNDYESTKDKCNQETRSKPPKEHTKRMSVVERFTCYICSTDFDNFEGLDEHLPAHVGSVTPICHLCNLEVTTVRHLNMHLQRVHHRKGKRIPCLECQNVNITREFSSNYKLQAHIKRVHQGIVEIAERKYVCTYCGKKFSRGTHLRLHENIHTKSTIFKCKHCTTFTTTSRSGLLRHERIHTSEKPFKCNMCDASFAQSNGLQAHKVNRHNDDRPFVCELCGDNVRFKSKYTMRIHMRIHENNDSGRTRKMKNGEIDKPDLERELKCKFCPAVYYKERFLCRHIIDKHPTENISMIPCEICNNQKKAVFFLSQKEKDLHMSYHTKLKTSISQKTRACKDCGECFPSVVLLARHRQSHFTNKCNKCGKEYKKRAALRLHYLTVHYESRPFKCDKCDASYGQLTQLIAHMRNHS
ncbi:zinc finger protein 3 homolog [Toxorhynchites rutilus septentrionalis]|uniref:zinc finger protein 3 homolog n=1 Tax=Toxorhynchites rutilus septentrionalis TaxID=329112 RepID=UPI00247B0B82|nr:zinc finger protein 3 homolog [Toxorhynchites rutilus septentrionalis]